RSDCSPRIGPIRRSARSSGARPTRASSWRPRTTAASRRSSPVAGQCRASKAIAGDEAASFLHHAGYARLGPHPVSAGACATHRGGKLDELTEDLAGVARVDDLLDPERLGAAER